MAGHQETFAEDVGGKLLLLAAMLVIFGIPATILLPLGMGLQGLGPGLGMLVGGLLIGAIAGLLLGYAQAKRDDTGAGPDPGNDEAR